MINIINHRPNYITLGLHYQTTKKTKSDMAWLRTSQGHRFFSEKSNERELS